MAPRRRPDWLTRDLPVVASTGRYVILDARESRLSRAAAAVTRDRRTSMDGKA
jgi:hypothetical protein